MGEAKRRSRNRAQILAQSPRCVYCMNSSQTIEHMPPRAMFKDRHRFSGLEFGSCVSCNTGTKAADAIASFMAHIDVFSGDDEWKVKAAKKLLETAEQHQLGFKSELFSIEKRRWRFDQSGILRDTVEVNGAGPILKRNLDIFSAKIGMALFSEHVGQPLSENEGVSTKWFLNAGLAQKEAESYLSILPIAGELRQGAKHSIEQFSYRYNCDKKSTFAALIGFHKNLHIFALASTMPEIHKLVGKKQGAVFTKVGAFSPQ